MCNFKIIELETNNNCPVCNFSGEITKITHSFTYHNGAEESLRGFYHCGHCGVPVMPTQKNRLDIGDKDRFEKAKFLFEETHLVSLRHDILEIPGYFYSQKNQIKKIQLNIRSVHVLNKDFIEQKPNHWLGGQENHQLFITTENTNGLLLPVLKTFVKSLNYAEVYIPFEYFKF